MQNKIIFVALLILLISMNSCDYEASIQYVVENKTEGEIIVVFESTSSIGESDSVSIELNTIDTLIIQSKGLRSVDIYEENTEFLKEFSKMDIYLGDSLKSKTNFLKSENWDYIEHNAHQATEKCIVYNTDFK